MNGTKLSARLQVCADLTIRGNAAADVGTDHGFLAIYLRTEGICPRVIAADLREKPLNTARRNAQAAGITEGLQFCLSNGLERVPMEGIGTVICAGMGGDLIAEILGAEPACRNPELQLILQPQSTVSDLRCWLGENGYRILGEHMAEDAGFIYTVLEVRWTGGDTRLEDGACFVPQGDTCRTDALYRRYMQRALGNVRKTVSGLRQAKRQDPEKLAHFEAGLRALQEWEDADENSQ